MNWKHGSFLAALIAASVIAQTTASHHESSPAIKSIPGFWVLFGLIGGMVFAGLALLLRGGIAREEDYYDER